MTSRTRGAVISVAASRRVVQDPGPVPRGSPGRDRGSASLQVVLLTPLLVVLMFAGWQAALWNHARTEARVVARETAVLVARDHLSVEAATAAAELSMSSTDLGSVEVVVANDGELVTVTITGSAPGILRGTSSELSVRAAVPLAAWVEL